MIVLDTSGALALMDRGEPAHREVAGLVRADPGPYVVPAATLGELTYFLLRRGGERALGTFVGDLESGALTLDCGEGDLSRVGELVRRYADLPLAFADAAVVACAERTRAVVLSLDADLKVVEREGRIRVVP